jgi:hypothetical protein
MPPKEGPRNTVKKTTTRKKKSGELPREQALSVGPGTRKRGKKGHTGSIRSEHPKH